MERLTDKQFNEYLNKYRNVYSIYRGEDNIRRIRCKNGEIFPYSLDGSILGYHCYESTHKRFYSLEKKGFTITQLGYSEAILIFPESILKTVVSLLKIERLRRKRSKPRQNRKSLNLAKVT